MTLVEIMVALVIFLMMMSILLPIYVRSMDARSRSEDLARVHATARGAFGLLRRDLQGAFGMAAETYDFSSPTDRSRFRWDAPQGGGYRQLTFVTAMDGSRNRQVDPLWPYEYDLVSWAVRGGALFRQVGEWPLNVSGSLPPGWIAEDTNPGLGVGQFVYTDSPATFANVGAYAGRPYIRTTLNTDLGTIWDIRFTYMGEDIPVLVTVGFDEDRTAPLPDWASDYEELDDTMVVDFGVNETFKLCSSACMDAHARLGPSNGGPTDRMYLVIIEPLSWSLGEEAESLVFRAPVGYDHAAGGVPEWVEVELTLAGPGRPLGVRRFAQRIAIPAGEVP
jgi:type II secretory pathway component PulJ